MKITLIMAATVNGKITRGDNPDVTAWTSREDQDLFAGLKHQFGLIIMGSRTYSENRNRIKLSTVTLRIVMTKNPEAYAGVSVPGQLEFTAEDPDALVRRLEKTGYTHALLVGGARLNTSFLTAGLIDELRLTVEPLLFGSGAQLFADAEYYNRMKLTEIQKLNDRGTLHLTYTIIKKP